VSGLQREQALERAQHVRLQTDAVCREIRAGTLPVADALFDPRACPLRLGRLLCSRRGWGEHRLRVTLRALRAATGDRVVDLHPGIRVRELTDRQKHALIAHLQEHGR
jgi:hypothetical protein